MTLNPLDWPAEPFLTFYCALLGVAALAIVILRRFIGSAQDHQPGAPLGLLELAWLKGGWVQAADTVLVSFLVAGAAIFETKPARLIFDPASRVLPRDINTFRWCLTRTRTRAEAHVDIRPRLQETEAALAARGLIPQADDASSLRWATACILLVVLLFGLAKILVGISRGRPVGYLTCLVLITLVVGVFVLARSPRTTRAGRAALRRETNRNSRAVRAPVAEELPLAFALLGAPALTGTPYAGFKQLMPSSGGAGSSGCGGGGGGGGGGGCGGCSGSD